MSKQNKSWLFRLGLVLLLVGFVAGSWGPKGWQIGLVMYILAFVLIAIAFIVKDAEVAVEKPKFFTFERGDHIYTNLAVVDPLLDADMTNFSTEERMFLEHCKQCRANRAPYPFTICHPGVLTMTQERICKYLLDGIAVSSSNS